MMNSFSIKFSLPLALALLFTSNLPTVFAQSVLVTIAEDPGQQTSTLNGTSQFDFESLPTGNLSNVTWNGVGQFDSLLVENGYFGFGAYNDATGLNSKFNWNGWPGWAGQNSIVSATTLTLDQSSSYFGLYWTAGDGDDVLSFYDGSDLVAEYTTQSLINSAGLTQDYYGDPNHMQYGRKYNFIEPYAFINFYGDANTSWDSVVLSQTSNAGSGFETDSLTVRTEALDPTLDDISQIGRVVAEVSGTETTLVDQTTTSWSIFSEENAPAAPTPSVFALLLFAAAFAAKDCLQKTRV